MVELRLFVPVYCNSLLATLNVRKAIRERAHDGHTMSMRAIGGSSGSSADTRKVCVAL